jgi:hypothetical protein
MKNSENIVTGGSGVISINTGVIDESLNYKVRTLINEQNLQNIIDFKELNQGEAVIKTSFEEKVLSFEKSDFGKLFVSSADEDKYYIDEYGHLIYNDSVSFGIGNMVIGSTFIVG